MSIGNMEEKEAYPLGRLCRRYSLSEVQSATHNFNEALIIGRGGFGMVYKGFFDGEDSTAVAIKRLNHNSNQGAHEFWTEIDMLSKFRHCNLVSLIGYCNDNKEMALVYEYMPCGTLYDHLHKMPTCLSWIQLLNVCVGAARGLDYLHTGTSTQHRIIHRDVKSSNILLDMNFQAKVSDFGLSKVGPADKACSFVDTNVKGSFGYLDPEYFFSGRLTRKSDVYSFGVVLFEVLCGRRAVDTSLSEEQHNLAKWVQNSIKQGGLDKIVDPRLQGNILPGCLKEFVKIAEHCLHRRSKKRPTMVEVVARLELAMTLQEGTYAPTDQEMSSDSDNYEDANYSFTVAENSSDAVDFYFQEHTVSPEEREIIVVREHQDEWILRAAEGEQSYIKSVDLKVLSSGTLEDEHNRQTSFIDGELVEKSMSSEEVKNIAIVPEEGVLNNDAPYVSGISSSSSSSRGGGHQNLETLGEASGSQFNTTHTTKLNLSRKLKKLFFASSGKNHHQSFLSTKMDPPLSNEGDWVDDILNRLLEVRDRPGKHVQLSESEIRKLCLQSREIFLQQPNLLELEAPVKICGDIHGQYSDLLSLFKFCGFPPESNYLFLGNYVDYGKQSLETICLLLAYKIKYPENFFLLRGSHECASVNRLYGFYDECKRRHNVRLWKVLIECFNCLPVAALVDDKIFCLHGGLSPDMQNFDQIRNLRRPTDVPDSGLLCDLLWSDPCKDTKGWGMNDKGVSYIFGPDKVSEFVLMHDLDLVCRANQVVEDGYEFFADRQLVTIFSAPNHRGEFDNAGAIMSVDETLFCTFQILKPAVKKP